MALAVTMAIIAMLVVKAIMAMLVIKAVLAAPPPKQLGPQPLPPLGRGGHMLKPLFPESLRFTYKALVSRVIKVHL